MNDMEMNNNEGEKYSNAQASSKIGNVKIFVTDTEDLKLYENQLESVFKQFQNLRKAHADFEQFVQMVRKDMMSKTITLKEVKMCESSSRSDKSYANIQLFMLKQYKQRMIKFENVNQDSIDNICDKNLSGDKVDQLVGNHIVILVKMKQMIDVSEKYVMVDMFDTVNSMKELCDQLDPSKCDQVARLSKSMISLDTVMQESRYSKPRTESESMNKTVDKDFPAIKSKKTFKSLTDHLIVITKTFTSRK